MVGRGKGLRQTEASCPGSVEVGRRGCDEVPAVKIWRVVSGGRGSEQRAANAELSRDDVGGGDVDAVVGLAIN